MNEAANIRERRVAFENWSPDHESGWSTWKAAWAAAIHFCRVEIEELEERLEVDHRHGYDGIACRDETIRQLDKLTDKQSRKIESLKKERRRLRRDCMEAYQIVGYALLGEKPDPKLKITQDDVVRALDNLSAAADGSPRPHNKLLPWPRSKK